MGPIAFEITMSRGDIEPIEFSIASDGQPIDFTPDNIYFTVKNDPNDRLPLFQKSLGAGTIHPGDEPGSYCFQIDPQDTNPLCFNKQYACDIEVVALSVNIKKTFFGYLTLEEEVTHASNEGAGT